MNKTRLYITTFLTLFILLFIQNKDVLSQSKTISGHVYNELNEPLPFVNIYIKGSTRGTTSNIDGAFSLNIRKDTSLILALQYVGYKKFYIDVPAGTNPSPIKVNLQIENVMLREVVIRTKKEDPAYPIIREAIKNRKYHDELVHSFAAQLYMKSNVKLDEIPESFFMIPKDQMPDSTELGMIYLSESVSNYYFEKPNKKREEMIASKISGTKTGYSFNRADMVMLSFYKNLINIGLSERSFISPIAGNALFYYKYRLTETFRDNDELIHKIEVIPKRKHDNIFKGYIYITDEKWSIHSVDLTISRSSQIDFTDSVHIRQVYVPVIDDIKMPLSLHITMYFKAFGFKAVTNFIGFFSNYRVNEAFPDNFFGSEVFAVTDETSKLDPMYWLNNRQAVLTKEEEKNYHEGDSIIAYHESDVYLDSMMRVRNAFKFKDMIFGGYGWRDKYRTKYYHLHPLTEAFTSYNTVEGLNVDLRQHFSKTWPKNGKQSLSFNLATKYSFTNKNFLFEQNVNYYFDRQHDQVIRLTFGKYNYDFNNNQPISNIQNTFRTILLKDNFIKLYQKEFIYLESSRELANGLEAKAFIEYANRSPLVNHEDYVMFKHENKEFTSNNPQNKLDDSPSFEANKALTVMFQLVFKFKQKFATYPNRKEKFGSKYPILKLEYRKGINTSFSDVDYDHLKIGVYDKLQFRNLGISTVSAEFGTFFNNSKTYFMDYKHFYGNQTEMIPIPNNNLEMSVGDVEPKSEISTVAFHSMDYYMNSTNSSYFSLHYEHHFNGWIINKFPLLRKSKMQVVSGMNYLHTGEGVDHTEFFTGLEHIFKILRVDYVGVRIAGEFYSKVRIGVGF